MVSFCMLRYRIRKSLFAVWRSDLHKELKIHLLFSLSWCYKQHKASLTVSGAVWVIAQPHSNPVPVCDPCGGTWPLFFWKEIQHQQWHAHWEAENYMTIPLSRHRHSPCVCAHDRKYFKAGVAKPRGRNHSAPCWTRRLSSINKRRRCSKHQSCKMMHQDVRGATPGVHLFNCGFSNTSNSKKRAKSPVFLHSLLFSMRLSPLATHLAIMCSTMAKALVCLFAKRHTRKYNFKQWPEVINLILCYSPPGCRHLAMKRRENSFGGNGRTCHFKDSPNKDCLGAQIFGKEQKEGEKCLEFIEMAVVPPLNQLQHFLRSLVLVWKTFWTKTTQLIPIQITRLNELYMLELWNTRRV